MRRKLFAVFATVAVLLAGAEAFARLYLGFGDPPLTVRDPGIEYLFAPSRTYDRFGNRISYNAYSMRSDEFARERTSADEVRILVMGDGVVNGGSLTDQDDLATTILQRRREEHGVNAVVGNISAGSWGPGNLLAYTGRFGWFAADIAFIVLSSHDLADVPAFAEDLGPDFPESPPALALQEVVVRYLPRYLPAFHSTSTAAPGAAGEGDRSRGARYLRDLLAQAKAAVPHVILLLHPTQEELARGGTPPDGEEILNIARDLNVPALVLSHRTAGEGGAGYRDNIHINALGQRLYGELLLCQTLVVLDLSAAENACRS